MDKNSPQRHLNISVEQAMKNRLKLISPQTEEQNQKYHEIRKTVLFSMEGRINPDYDPFHPDESKDGNYPLVLMEGDNVIGVIRIDKHADDAVIFRLMAIKVDCQRKGYGRSLISLAEQFALALGRKKVLLNADPDAVGFYQKCGFVHSNWQEENKGAWIEDTVPMEKYILNPLHVQHDSVDFDEVKATALSLANLLEQKTDKIFL